MIRPLRKKNTDENYHAGTFPFYPYLKIRPAQPLIKNTPKPLPTIEVLDISNAVTMNSNIDKVIHKFKEVFITEENNYTTYKRSISKILHQNQLAHMLIMFRGLKGGGKTHSLVGNLADPGMLPVLMLELMQEKYSKPSYKLQVLVSFLEFKDEKIFDLLSSTSIPLSFWNKNVLFPTSWFQVNEFLEFLKLFKIALFYNRSRDIAFSNFKNNMSNSHFIARVKICKINDHRCTTTQVYFVDTACEREFDPDLSLAYSQQAYFNILQEMRQASLSSNKNGTVNFDQSQFTTLLRPCLQNGSINNFSCISESEVLTDLERELAKSTGLTQISTKSEPLVQEVPEIRLKKRLIEILEHLQNIKERIISCEFERYSDLSNEQELLLRIASRLNRLLETMAKKVKTLSHQRLRLFTKQSLLINIVKEKVAKVIKNSNIKQFYSAKTYSSLQLEIRNHSEKVTTSLSSCIASFCSQSTSVGNILKSLRKFIHELNKEVSHMQIFKPFAVSCLGLFTDCSNCLIGELHGYDTIQLISYHLQLDEVLGQLLSGMREVLDTINALSKTILNCYCSSYLNTPNNIIFKIQQAGQLPSLQDMRPEIQQHPSTAKFKKIEKRCVKKKSSKVQYLSQYLRDRGISRERKRKYEIRTPAEPPSRMERTELESELAVIPEQVTRRHLKSSQKNEIRLTNRKSTQIVQFMVKIP